MNLDEFAMNARRLANSMGYGPTLSPSFIVAGITVDHLPVNRKCTVGDAAPALYQGATVQLWVDSSLNVWKSSNWYQPSAPTWEQVGTYESMFLDSQDGASTPQDQSLPLTGGTMQGPVYLFREPVASNEAVPRSYVDSIVSMIAAGRLYIEKPVSTIADLRALDVSTVPDEQVIFVESVRKMYAYDAQAVGVDDDGSYIITPVSGVGRWIATVPNVFDGGVLP